MQDSMATSFVNLAHYGNFGVEIKKSSPSSSSFTPSKKLTQSGPSNTTEEPTNEWYHWAMLVGLLLAIIGSSISSSVGAYFAIKNKDKNKRAQMEGGEARGAGSNGSKSKENGSKEK